jgi:hypothetical protein
MTPMGSRFWFFFTCKYTPPLLNKVIKKYLRLNQYYYHDHMCVSYNILCVMVVSSAYLGFPSLGLEESGSSSKTHPHVVSGGIL